MCLMGNVRLLFFFLDREVWGRVGVRGYYMLVFFVVLISLRLWREIYVEIR